MDALAMSFPDNSFDLVWACESGEHMPDKKKYIEEMTRVLKPGGKGDRDGGCEGGRGSLGPIGWQAAARRSMQRLTRPSINTLCAVCVL